MLGIPCRKMGQVNFVGLLEKTSQSVFGAHLASVFAGRELERCRVKTNGCNVGWMELHIARPKPKVGGVSSSRICRVSLNSSSVGEGSWDPWTEVADSTAWCLGCPIPVILTDGSASVRCWNPAAETFFGYRSDEVVGEVISRLAPPDCQNEWMGLAREMGAGTRGIKMDTACLHKTGRRIAVSVNSNGIRSLDGGWVGQAWFILEQHGEGQLERQIAEAVDAEKHRMGMELHDGLGSLLTVLDCRTKTFARALRSKGLKRESSEALAISTEIRGAIRQMRSLASGLQPLDGEADSLILALRNLADRAGRTRRIQCRFLEPAQPLSLGDASMANHLFAIACEAVQNAIRHSGGSRITIQLKARDGKLRLSVADNGKGVEPERCEKPGMGLGTMSSRARLLGGRLAIVRRPEGGTRVVCEAGLIGCS